MIGVRLSDTSRRASGWRPAQDVSSLRRALSACWADYRRQQAPSLLREARDLNQYRLRLATQCSDDERQRLQAKWRAAGHRDDAVSRMWANYMQDRTARLAYARAAHPDAALPERLAVQVQPMNPATSALSPWNDHMPVWINQAGLITRATTASFQTQRVQSPTLADLWAGIVIVSNHDRSIAEIGRFVARAIVDPSTARRPPRFTLIHGGNSG